jgi:hypothetical protein
MSMPVHTNFFLSACSKLYIKKEADAGSISVKVVFHFFDDTAIGVLGLDTIAFGIVPIRLLGRLEIVVFFFLPFYLLIT